jgi:hypothetical protein
MLINPEDVDVDGRTLHSASGLLKVVLFPFFSLILHDSFFESFEILNFIPFKNFLCFI